MSGRKSIRTTEVICLLLTFILTGCTQNNDHGGGDKERKFRLMLISSPTGLDAPLFYGKSRGVFAKYGIDLTIQFGNGSQRTYDAVASGRADAGVTVFSAIALSAGKGGDLVSFGSLQQVDSAGILMSKSSHVTSTAGLRGKTLLASSGSALRRVLPVLLSQAGVPEDRVSVKDVVPGALYAAYVAGQADGMITVLPNSVPVVGDKRPSVALPFIENGIVQPGLSLVAQPEDLRSERDTYVRFMRALIEADSLAQADIREAAGSVSEEAPQLTKDVTADQFRAAQEFRCWADSPNGSSSFLQPAALWKSGISLFEKSGMIESGALNSEALYTNGIVRTAVSSDPPRGPHARERC